jgi:two-component system, sensor histidine kinase YcbA
MKKSHFYRSLVMLTIATVLLGEISFFPFGTGFRFGLGSAVFSLGLILYPELLRLRVGGIAGVAVVLFRVAVDLLIRQPSDSFYVSLSHHLPAFSYYFLLTFFLRLFNLQRYWDHPLILGTLISGFDFLSNTFELFIRQGVIMSSELVRELITASIVSLGKGFVIIGIVSIFSVYRLRIVQEEEKLRLEKTLLLASGLYEETFFLKKSMTDIENITARSFDLYQQVKRKPDCDPKLARLALGIAEEVHEVKKDAQRVVAGLSRLVMVKQEDAELRFSEIFSLLIKANRDYIRSLNREISIKETVFQEVKEVKVRRLYPIISILNNLLANAIEAMEDGGHIVLTAGAEGTQLKLAVFNDGPPIAELDLSLIFEPGFTTKYSTSGSASTGIGLTHVREIVELLKGKVQVDSSKGGTTFTVELPIAEIS